MTVINDTNKIIDFTASQESLIFHKKALCLDEDGNIPVIKGNDGGQQNYEFLNVITDMPPLSNHIDIMLEKPFFLTFDLGEKALPVDRFVLMGYGTGAYDIREFDLYAGDGEDIYNKEHLVCNYKCELETVMGSRNTCDTMVIFDKPVTAKKFGIKISKPNASDNCMRISYVGVYSSVYNNTCGFLKKYGENLLSPSDISVQNSEVLCDAVAYDGGFVEIENSSLVLNKESLKGKIRIFYKGENVSVSVNNKKLEVKELFENDFCAEYDSSENGKIVFEISGKAKIYEVGLYNDITEITVTDETVTEDFNGIGGCVCPSAFMDYSLSQGFNKAYWEKEKSRVNLCKPALVRLWFQPDWFIIDEETYYRREYDFDSEKMQAVYPYLDLFKESGIEVEMNYGWKVDDRITSWYSIPGVPRARESAPKDLEEFAYSCTEFLTELIERRGYTNIKYLTFYNEPSARYVYSEYYTGDFHVGPPNYEKLNPGEMAPEQFAYWHKMLVAARKAVSERGLDKRIKVWGPEFAVGNQEECAAWLKKFSEDKPCLLDTYTLHRYSSSDGNIEDLTKTLRKISDIPLCVTEFSARSGSSWEINNAQMALAYINNGYIGALLWMLSGTAMASPLNFNIDGTDENMWRYLPAKTEGANSIFYELCLFMRYIPSHSRILRVLTPEGKETKVFDTFKLDWKTEKLSEIRAAALYTPKGEITVIVESKRGISDKKIRIALPDKKNLKLYKFSVGCKNDTDAPAKLPACCGVITAADGVIEDVLPDDYNITFYTEQKPYPQVVCDSDVYYMKAGEERKINYYTVDSDVSDVMLEITEGKDKASLSENKISVNADASVGDMISVKIKIKEKAIDSYFVLIVKVTD